MINSSLFVKIFGLTCILMIICCSFTYAFIAWLVPKTYSSDLDEVLNRNAENLIAELEGTNGLESGYLFDEFLLNNDVIMQLYDERLNCRHKTIVNSHSQSVMELFLKLLSMLMRQNIITSLLLMTLQQFIR